MKIKRKPNGELLALVQHENSSNFWASDLTECPKFEEMRDKLEVTLMTAWWNIAHHDEFEIWWNCIKRFYQRMYMP